MSIRIAATASFAAATMLLTSALLAQNVPTQFVITGKSAEKIQDFSTINMATAERLATACEKAAADQGVLITVMILDKDGNHVYMDRMDGQAYQNIITAEWKARTALLAREPSKISMNRMIQDPGTEFEDLQLGLFPNAGGLPIVVNKQLIGAIGVGGSAPKPPVWSDEICAHKALEAVIGAGVAPLVEDLPARRNPNPGNEPVPRFNVSAPPKSSLPPEFVVSGKAAATVLDGDQISLAAAKKIASACRDWANSNGKAMSMYVIDTLGEFIHMERMDGVIYNDGRTALLKAQTAIRMRQPTSIRAAQLKNDESGYPRSAVQYGFYGASGGVPIVVDGQMIGAVGVSGTGDSDEACAVAGLKAAFADHATLPVYPAAK
jgi:glc operon protein GlcG